jgi:predicted kinase
VREDTIGQYLLVTCGLPFSGKSTLSRALARQLGIAHVEVDALHAANGLRAGIDPIERADWIAAYQRGYAELEALLPEGRSVVFDAVSYRRLQRNRVRRVAERLGVPATVVLLDVSVDQARSRLERNRLTRERVNVPMESFLEVAGGMQWPDPDEAVIRYSPDEPLAEWVERVVRPMLTGATVPA